MDHKTTKIVLFFIHLLALSACMEESSTILNNENNNLAPAEELLRPWQNPRLETFYNSDNKLVSCSRNTLDEEGRLLSSTLSFINPEDAIDEVACNDNDLSLHHASYEYYQNDSGYFSTISDRNGNAISCKEVLFNANKLVTQVTVYTVFENTDNCSAETASQVSLTVNHYLDELYLLTSDTFNSPGLDNDWTTLEDNQQASNAKATWLDNNTTLRLDQYLPDMFGELRFAKRVITEYNHSQLTEKLGSYTLAFGTDEFINFDESPLDAYMEVVYNNGSLNSEKEYSTYGADLNWETPEDNTLLAIRYYQEQ